MRTTRLALASLFVAAPVALLAATGAQAETTERVERGQAQIGEPAPDFSLPDLDGNTVSLSEHRGKVVVLEWFNPDCPFVVHLHDQNHFRDTATQLAERDVVWLAINSGAPGKQGHGRDHNAAARDKWELPYPVLLDESGNVGRLYDAKTTPQMVVIDRDGSMVYNGAIDNAPLGRVQGSRVDYLQAALEDVFEGRPVRTPQTRPYGCTVKY